MYRGRVAPPDVDVRLRPWAPDDLPLLERLLGDPAMTVHIGGPESAVKLRRLHNEYLSMRPPSGRMFVIVPGDGTTPAGSVGYWLADRGGETVWELGCSVLPAFQGRGIGTRSLELACVAAFRDAARPIHAYPSVDNDPSNAMCRRAGFRLAGEADVERRPGHSMRVYDWVLDPNGRHDAQPGSVPRFPDATRR
jgi:RimJ/RimL family protein N-acetyltransferase